MKKTTLTCLNRKGLAFAFLAGLTTLLLLLPAPKSAATTHYFQSSTILIQDTLKYNKSLRTFVTDPSDGIEKKIELRYQNEILTDVLIDGKRIRKEDYQKHEKIIKKAEAEIIDINRDASAAKEEIRRAMEELRNIDLEEIRKDIDVTRDIIIDIHTEEIEKEIQKEIEKVRKEIEKLKTEVVIKGVDELYMVAEADKAEILKIMEEIRKDIQIDITDIRADIANGDHWSIIVDTDIDTKIDSGDTLSPGKKEKMHKRLEELEANNKNTKNSFPAAEVS